MLNRVKDVANGIVDEFQKGNLEALVESGKILASGMQDMGRTYVEEAKGAAATVQGDVKKIAAVKSPTELLQLQGEIARRNFDAMVSTTSKNTEAMLKLANEAFAPLSSRMSRAAAKGRMAAEVSQSSIRRALSPLSLARWLDRTGRTTFVSFGPFPFLRSLFDVFLTRRTAEALSRLAI